LSGACFRNCQEKGEESAICVPARLVEDIPKKIT